MRLPDVQVPQTDSAREKTRSAHRGCRGMRAIAGAACGPRPASGRDTNSFAAQAEFAVELGAPAGAAALSNMAEEGEPAPGPGGLVRHRYARSPAMSTYLVAARAPRARRPAPAARAPAERCASRMLGCSASMCSHMLSFAPTC